MNGRQYRTGGALIGLAGLAAAVIFYYGVGSVPLTAGGITAAITGATIYVVGTVRRGVSVEYADTLQRVWAASVEAAAGGEDIEAVYLPGGEKGEYGQVWLKAERGEVVLPTAGSYCLPQIKEMLGPGPDEMENAARYLLTGVLEIAETVNLSTQGQEVIVTVSGMKLRQDDRRQRWGLGSPTAAILAALVSGCRDQPVRIREETGGRGKGRIVLVVGE